MFSLFKENIRIAFDSIRSQLLRTILTILIIAIGITALVGILSAVSALENTISSDFSSMGANTFNVQRYDFNNQRANDKEKINPVISYREVKTFEEDYQFPFTQTSISFQGTSTAEVKYENEKTDPEVQVFGVNENYITNAGLEVELGRSFNYFDIQNSNTVCVIGSDLRKALLQDVNPLNKTISIRGSKFKVIGVLKAKGATFGNNQDLRVLMPLQKARTIYTNANINYNLSVKTDNKNMLEGAQDEAILLFRNIRGLNPIENNNFALQRSDDLINRISTITSGLSTVAWIVSIITIFGSTIALLNMMLVSVSERTREIGVRKALGAKRATIAFQFFIETIIIGQLGGLLGICLGILVGWGVSAAAGFEFTTPWLAMTSAVIITFVVAVISGLMPAIKAAKLDPVESLRYE
ncbi:ABC transporter permease [Subsaximicrobium wynnwilliamsii]|uniref:ABC transporter permease n=1 Tax=Subsaximicrobium wynnwilliamsii TaxID=291179 RepID=A0A5C6ZMZ9_9FLAO|nr:ABC transporter permease [Subsaximicrobium wynnwilliamsii]TXD81638.1 ABC transporter permease [Subsaximicrobium wynnwilliamsii]TXD91035.1 ABC transporter permease [Subsaximicrobium wynnwilliamsii]TXE01086.1 ABC transporter permease [Subsaximicrobium wynnwilliamsii]